MSIDKDLECTICFEMMQNAAMLPCSHSYCEACITEWLAKDNLCPECKIAPTGKPAANIPLRRIIDSRAKEIAQAAKATLSAAPAKAAARPESIVALTPPPVPAAKASYDPKNFDPPSKDAAQIAQDEALTCSFNELNLTTTSSSSHAVAARVHSFTRLTPVRDLPADFAATDIVVELVGKNTSHDLYFEAKRKGISWEDARCGIGGAYCNMRPSDTQLLAKYDTVKIGNLTLYLFQPQGNTVDHEALARAAKGLVGGNWISSTEAYMFTRSPPVGLCTLDEETRMAIEVENDYARDVFIQRLSHELKENAFTVSPILESVILHYRSTTDTEVPAYLLLRVAKVNKSIVTFVENSGTFGNREALAAYVSETFPKARFFTVEQTSDVIPSLATPHEPKRGVFRRIRRFLHDAFIRGRLSH